MNQFMITAARGASQIFWVLFWSFGAVAGLRAELDRLETPDGRAIVGRLTARGALVWEFLPQGGGRAVPVVEGAVIRLSGGVTDAAAAPPSFRVLMGEALRLSGVLRSIDPGSVVLWAAGVGREVTLPRPGVQAVIQRPGEARVLAESFDRLDAGRWVTTGSPALVTAPVRSAPRALALPGPASSVAARLNQPVTAGQIELAFHDDKVVAPKRRSFLEAEFQGPAGASVIRVILGWAEETLAVETPRGPALAIQRLPRAEGWHRLTVRFDGEATEIAVDGKELAHGKGPSGPLVALKLAQSSPGEANANPTRAVFDDLQVVRFAEPPSGLEIDVDQDEARLISGDQLYGIIDHGDAESVVILVDGNPTALSFSELAGIYFRRLPRQGKPVSGLLARVAWRSAPGNDPADLDFAEGAIQDLDEHKLTIDTPYAGILEIPRERLTSIALQGQGQRIVIDPAIHHLGNEISIAQPMLDPPQPEGGLLTRFLQLDHPPADPAFMVLDMLLVVGEDNEPVYSRSVREGELRTYLKVNGQRVDYINRYIKTRNETPERIRVPVPQGLLKEGRNTITLELTGMARKPNELDDLGVLQSAIEFRSQRPGRSSGGGP